MLVELFETLSGKKNSHTFNLKDALRIENEDVLKICAKRDIEHLLLEEWKDSSKKT